MGEYNRKAFGLSWMIISGFLEIWWIIAVITSAVLAKDYECGWAPVSGGDWFVLLILIIIFSFQFGIGEVIGLIEYKKSQNENIAWFPRWVIVCMQCIAGLFLVLNILAVAQETEERDEDQATNDEIEDCTTGQIMLVTAVVNLAFTLITFVFSFLSLPLADVNAPENQNRVVQIPQKDEEDVGDVEENQEIEIEEKKKLVADTEQKESEPEPAANGDTAPVQVVEVEVQDAGDAKEKSDA